MTSVLHPLIDIDERCVISLKKMSKLEPNEIVFIVPCKHKFSRKHFIKYCYLCEQKTCPICRQRFTQVYSSGNQSLVFHNVDDYSFFSESLSKLVDSIKHKLVCCLFFGPSESNESLMNSNHNR